MHAFETTRLSIELLKSGDNALYCHCYGDAQLMQLIGEPLNDDELSRSFATALKFNYENASRRLTWAMRDKRSLAYAGLLALIEDPAKPARDEAEIGAIILARFQNAGYAAEAISALVDRTFAHTSISMLRTRHSLRNQAANRLMNKLGFQFCDVDTERIWLLHRSDWQKLRNPAS